MREPRPVAGAKTPLFDRLLDDGIDVRRPVASVRALDMAGLRESVRQDLSRLLNTRTALRNDLQDSLKSTVLGYGVPPLSTVAPQNEQERVSLAVTLEKIIANFEPRLQKVKVVIQQDKRDPRNLLGVVYAQLMFGSVSEPVHFPLSLEELGKKVDVTAS